MSLPDTRISSMRPSSPVGTCILFWKCSGALDIPKGSLLKQYLPYSVMKVVSNRDFLESGICQNPLLASSLLNTLAPVSCASVNILSTWGRGWTSRRTLSLRGFKSTHIPFFFGATTIPAHHGVGSSTFVITPMASIFSNSSLTLGCSGINSFTMEGQWEFRLHCISPVLYIIYLS